MMKAPELLSPAGSLKHMRHAFAFGADAVYAGQPRYSLRVRNNSFDLDNLAQGIEEAHRLGKKFFVVSNIYPHNSKMRTFLKDITPVMELQPDALIMSDPGMIMLVREHWPEMDIHLSVQSNVVNYQSVKFWQQVGLRRIILSRELSLDEIAEIRQECPDMELEVFVHGALCIAYSGRCLLSGYINHRDPNQGTCTNACRWKYQAHEARQTESGDIVPILEQDPTGSSDPEAPPVYLLQEEGRPERLMPAFEDEHGTYILNSKDLRAVQHVRKLMEIGIDCLKIEGRTKSYYYVARTAQIYRRAIDDALAGRAFDLQLMDELEGLANRGYTEGFLRRHVHDEYQNYEQGHSIGKQQQFVGELTGTDRQWAAVEVKNRFQTGDRLEWITPAGNLPFTLETLLDRNDQPAEVAPGSGHQVKIPLPEGWQTQAPEMALLVRNLN